MKVVIFGATGRTGQIMTRKALARGYEVTAAVRNPAGLAFLQHERLRVVKADVMDTSILEESLEGTT